MFRSRISRTFVATAGSVVLILGLMAGTVTAGDNRVVFFGSSVNGVLDISPVTTGGVFAFDVVATNEGGQNLSHGTIGFGSGAAPWPGGPSANGLPAGFTILSATVDDPDCASVLPTASGYSCETGALRSGASVRATFVVQTNDVAGLKHVWASFKVAEYVNDQGANRNTFFAYRAIDVGQTDSNRNSTYIASGAFQLGTNGQAGAATDLHVTSVKAGPGGTSKGFISIVEENGPTGCAPAPRCIGQLVRLNVNNGAPVAPYLEWTAVIRDDNVVISKGGVIHTPDVGPSYDILTTKAWSCAKKPVPCMVSYTVDKSKDTTTIVFRTVGNGAARFH